MVNVLYVDLKDVFGYAMFVFGSSLVTPFSGMPTWTFLAEEVKSANFP